MYLDEISLQPGIIIYGFVDRCLLPSGLGDGGVGNVWELGRGVVSPDDDIVHRIWLHACTSSNLEEDIGEVRGRSKYGECKEGDADVNYIRHRAFMTDGRRNGRMNKQRVNEIKSGITKGTLS